MGTLIGSTFRDALALRTNGTPQYASNASPTFLPNTAGAFSFWYKPTTVLTSNGFKSIIAMGNGTAGNNATFMINQRWGSATGSTPIIEILVRRTNGGTFSATVGSTTLVAGTLYHVVVQSNGTAWTIYVNGVAQTLNNWQTGDGVNPGNWFGDMVLGNPVFTIGARMFDGSPGMYSDQDINEVTYFNRDLTGPEITALYNGGTPGNPHRITSLGSAWKSWWRMGDSRDDATTVYDEIGTNNLTLVNLPSYVAA